MLFRVEISMEVSQKNKIKGAEEMATGLKHILFFWKDLKAVPTTHINQFKTIYNLAPGHMIPSLEHFR